MEGYIWLYHEKQKARFTDVTGCYDEFRKEGWSAYSDFRDLPFVEEEKQATPKKRAK